MRLKFSKSRMAGVGLMLLAAAGCGEERPTGAADDANAPAGEPAPDIETSTAEAAAVAASDEYGPFGSQVSGIALWAHPKLPYEGLLFAASDDGIVSYNIEDGTEIAHDDGFKADGVAIAYIGEGAAAEGVIASRDAEEGQFRFYTIDNETRMPALRPALMVNDPGVAGYCLGKAPEADGEQGLQLVVVNGKSFTRHELQFTAAGVSTNARSAGAAPDILTACAVDDVDGSVFLASETGTIYRTDADETANVFASTGVRNVAGLAVALNQHKDNGDIQGQVALLDGANGGLHLFDREDGHALGVAAIGASFDVEAVKAATALGVGYGNYGAVYRNGALALAANGDTPVIRLVSWNGVLNALGQPEAAAADPRALQPEEDDGLIIDIDDIKVIDP